MTQEQIDEVIRQYESGEMKDEKQRAAVEDYLKYLEHTGQRQTQSVPEQGGPSAGAH